MKTDKQIKNENKRCRQRMAKFDKKIDKKNKIRTQIDELVKKREICEDNFDVVNYSKINNEIDKCRHELNDLK
jgi:hypothetical protein